MLSPFLKILTALIIILGISESLRFQTCHHDAIEFTHSFSSHPLFQEKLIEEDFKNDTPYLTSKFEDLKPSNDYSFKKPFFYFVNFYIKSSQRYNFISHLPPPFFA